MKKLFKLFCSLLLATSLCACNDKGEMSDAEKQQWALENGYIKGDTALSLWAAENGYLKGESSLSLWATENGYLKGDASLSMWATENGYLKGDNALNNWASKNGYLKSTEDLVNWAKSNGYFTKAELNNLALQEGYMKDEASLVAWAEANGFLKEDSDLTEWAKDNGFLRETTELNAWAENNGYMKDDKDLDEWAENNGYLKDEDELDKWAKNNNYLKEEYELHYWAESNGYMKDEADLAYWAMSNGYLKSEMELKYWASQNGYLKGDDLHTWAKKEGYIKGEDNLSAWAWENGFIKGESALSEWAISNGFTRNEELDEWAMSNGYLKGDEALSNWAMANGFTSNDQLDAWALSNGYVKTKGTKPLLEVTYNNFKDDLSTPYKNEKTKNLTEITYYDLKAKFDGGYDFLVLYGDPDCSTSNELKSVLADWIGETKYKIYFISTMTMDDGFKSSVMDELGNPSITPTLFAVIDGVVVDTLVSSVDEDKVSQFIEKYYEIEEFNATTYRLENLSELRSTVASGEQFILFVAREADPDTKNMLDIHRDDTYRKIISEYDGKVYTIVTEDTIAEHANSEIWNDVTKWNGYWGSINTTAEHLSGEQSYAHTQSKVTHNNKAETLAYMIAGGVFDTETLLLGQEEFLDAAIEYANNAYLNDDGTMFMKDSIRSVPGLVAVNFEHNVQYAELGDEVFSLIKDYAEVGSKTVGEVTYITTITTKTIYVYDEGQEKFVDKVVTYERYVPKALSLNGTAGSEIRPFTGDNPVALWITHKNAFVGALGGKGAANLGTYTNNITFSNIFTDCLTSRNNTYHTMYELDMVQAQTMNWITSWTYVE